MTTCPQDSVIGKRGLLEKGVSPKCLLSRDFGEGFGDCGDSRGPPRVWKAKEDTTTLKTLPH